MSSAWSALCSWSRLAWLIQSTTMPSDFDRVGEPFAVRSAEFIERGYASRDESRGEDRVYALDRLQNMGCLFVDEQQRMERGRLMIFSSGVIRGSKASS